MEELLKIVNGLDADKKKELFSMLKKVESTSDVINVIKKYGVEISKEVAEKIYAGVKTGTELSDEDLEKVSGGRDYFAIPNGVVCFI